MNIAATHRIKKLLAVVAAAGMLTACASAPTRPQGADTVRSKLTRLQSDPQLAARAPVAIKEAEVAVRAAEEPQRDTQLADHLVSIADRKVDIAYAQAQSRLLEDERQALSEQRANARLDSRTREADAARMQAEAAMQEAEALRQQLLDMDAKETERGMVITLGDVLFDTDKATLRGGAISALSKLVAFLVQNPDRGLVIEGHTDSVGDDAYNLDLSRRRADSVKAYLMKNGIDPGRMSATGLGESSPVSGNDSPTGRQQNRRVEVIISTPVT